MAHIPRRARKRQVGEVAANPCEQLAVPGVRGLRPYVPGQDPDLVARRHGVARVIKLASNENPLGPGELARQALCCLPDLGRYPDGNASLLRAALAERLGVQPRQLVFGNGSNDVLELAVRAFAGPGRRVLFPQYSFAVFALAAKLVGADHDVVAPMENHAPDVDGLLRAVRPDTSMLMLANPNNPTGGWLDRDQVELLLRQAPEHVVVVLDEAYAEYMGGEEGYESAARWCDRFPNLVVSRTFSKIHGLAGLRVGYGVSSAPLADLMNRVRQPFNNNAVALLAAQAALADFGHIEKSLRVTATGRRQWLQAAEELGLPAGPAPASFVCLKLPVPGSSLAAELELSGILLRPLDNYGMPEHVRVSFGLEHENRQAIGALRQALAKAG